MAPTSNLSATRRTVSALGPRRSPRRERRRPRSSRRGVRPRQLDDAIASGAKPYGVAQLGRLHLAILQALEAKGQVAARADPADPFDVSSPSCTRPTPGATDAQDRSSP